MNLALCKSYLSWFSLIWLILVGSGGVNVWFSQNWRSECRNDYICESITYVDWKKSIVCLVRFSSPWITTLFKVSEFYVLVQNCMNNKVHMLITQINIQTNSVNFTIFCPNFFRYWWYTSCNGWIWITSEHGRGCRTVWS